MNHSKCNYISYGDNSCSCEITTCLGSCLDKILSKEEAWVQYEQWQNFVRKSIGVWRTKFYDKHYKTMDPKLLTKRCENYYYRGYRRVNKLFFAKLFNCT